MFHHDLQVWMEEEAKKVAPAVLKMSSTVVGSSNDTQNPFAVSDWGHDHPAEVSEVMAPVFVSLNKLRQRFSHVEPSMLGFIFCCYVQGEVSKLKTAQDSLVTPN